MERKCQNCAHYSEGVTERQRHQWEGTNLGKWATGVCTLYFPRGYIARKPPHPAMATGSCFQFKEITGQTTLFEETNNGLQN